MNFSDQLWHVPDVLVHHTSASGFLELLSNGPHQFTEIMVYNAQNLLDKPSCPYDNWTLRIFLSVGHLNISTPKMSNLQHKRPEQCLEETGCLQIAVIEMLCFFISYIIKSCLVNVSNITERKMKILNLVHTT